MPSNARRHTSTRSLGGMPWKSGRIASSNSEGHNGCRRPNAAHGTRPENGPPNETPVCPQTSRSRELHPCTSQQRQCRGDVARANNVVAGSVAQDAGNAVAGGVAQDAAQDTAMPGGADERRTSPSEKEDDEEQVKRQRTERKTEPEMEVSNVAKIDDSRRILDLRRDGWERENISHRDAAMFCACELRARFILKCCPKRTQLESTWDLCRPQWTQGLGYVCEFVGNIADDPMTKNIPVKVCRAHHISHLKRRQHPPPFAESHEGNWTAEQPGHRQGGGRQP